MTESSPIGLKYLENLIANNFLPSIVIVSRTKKLTKMALETVHERTQGRFSWKNIDELLSDKDIPVYFTDNHNSEHTQSLLKKYKIDVAILGGTNIIKKVVIDIPKIGVINTHPGILPNYRGCSCVEWSLYNNDEVGASCHFVTPEIDAGKIICAEAIPIHRGDTYYDVRLKSYNHQSKVLIDGLRIISSGDYQKSLKENIGGKYYDPMPKEMLEKVIIILKDELYKKYV